jgi:hypothetical protein
MSDDMKSRWSAGCTWCKKKRRLKLAGLLANLAQKTSLAFMKLDDVTT